MLGVWARLGSMANSMFPRLPSSQWGVKTDSNAGQMLFISRQGMSIPQRQRPEKTGCTPATFQRVVGTMRANFDLRMSRAAGDTSPLPGRVIEL